MNRAFSVYLDLVRFTAALCVVANHFIHEGLLPTALRDSVPDFGREAVMVFFVLSGYVIAWSTDERDYTLRTFLVARASRIYSVALPVLLLAFLVDSIGRLSDPGQYPHAYQYERFYVYIPLHLAFLGEAWTLAERPFTIPPYWSLSYEVWYYLLFAAVYFYTGTKRVWFALAALVIMGYQHWLLFPIWASGWALYRLRDRLPLGRGLARAGFAASIAVLLAVKLGGVDRVLWQLGRTHWPFGSLPSGSADQWIGDYVTCALVLVNFHCARFLVLAPVARLETPIRALAAYTFTLYLVHTLVIYTWLYNFAYDARDPAHVLGMLAAIAGVTALVGELTEKRRAAFRSVADAVAGRVNRALARCPAAHAALVPNRKVADTTPPPVRDTSN